MHGAARRNRAHYRRCAAGFLRCLDAPPACAQRASVLFPAPFSASPVFAPSLKSMRVSVVVHAAAVRAPPRCGAAGGSETHTTTRGGLDSCNHACERLRVKRSQHPLPYAHSFCGIGRDCSLCRHELLPAAYTRTIKHTACPARRDSREAAGEGLGRSTRWTRLITPRFDQLGFLVALPSPLDKQQKGVLRRCIAGVDLHTRVCTRKPATSAAVQCAQQRTRTCRLSVHLHLKRAEANKPS